MRNNDAFFAKIAITQLRKICVAIFALAETLPTSATLVGALPVASCKGSLDGEPPGKRAWRWCCWHDCLSGASAVGQPAPILLMLTRMAEKKIEVRPFALGLDKVGGGSVWSGGQIGDCRSSHRLRILLTQEPPPPFECCQAICILPQPRAWQLCLLQNW